MPELISKTNLADEHKLGVDYISLIAILAKSTQEQEAKINSQAEEIELLKQQIKEIYQKIK